MRWFIEASKPFAGMIAGDGKDFTLPTLDLDDFIGLSFTTGPDGKIYQLPSQQFSNLYWFRADWFERADLKSKFKDIYGYELGVPVNWSAYEEIAEFFSEKVKVLYGQPVYGHMDYGKKDPSLGWRFTDAWFSMAGAGDVGIPNGLPVDEWGIRVEGCQPVGSSVSSGESSAPKALDGLAAAQDKVMQRLERAKVQGECGPKLNTPRDPEYWLAQLRSPKAKLANEKPQGQTVAYDQLLKSWQGE